MYHKLVELMLDSYSNYFCTDMFKKCTKKQRVTILSKISSNFLQISFSFYGAHPLQALIGEAESEEEYSIILNCLTTPEEILNLSLHKIGCNVIQKILISIPEKDRPLLNSGILQNFQRVVYHANGKSVFKSFLATNHNEIIRSNILEFINTNFLQLCKHEYGNFALQCILEIWSAQNFLNIYSKIVAKNIIKLCTTRCSSHIVEKIIDLIDGLSKKRFMFSIYNNDKSYQLLDCKYGVFVLKKIIDSSDLNEHELIKNTIRMKFMNSNDLNNDQRAYILSVIDYL